MEIKKVELTLEKKLKCYALVFYHGFFVLLCFPKKLGKTPGLLCKDVKKLGMQEKRKFFLLNFFTFFHFWYRKMERKKKLRKRRLNSKFKIEIQFWNPFWIKCVYIHKNVFKNLLFNFLLFSQWFEKRRMSFKNQTFKKNFWNMSSGILFAHTEIKCISFFSILSIKKEIQKCFFSNFWMKIWVFFQNISFFFFKENEFLFFWFLQKIAIYSNWFSFFECTMRKKNLFCIFMLCRLYYEL